MNRMRELMLKDLKRLHSDMEAKKIECQRRSTDVCDMWYSKSMGYEDAARMVEKTVEKVMQYREE